MNDHTSPEPQPATDRTALREQIAEALMRWAERGNDPQYASIRRPSVVRENAYSRADAVLAVLPEPADRAAVLREAADAAEQTFIHGVTPAASERDEIWDQAVRAVATMLRRLAAEPAAAGPDQTRPSCPDPIECGHEAALGQARATNQRLNYRAQQLEAELATYRRAVRQWEVSERGTYIPHSSLRAIGKACGVDALGTVRHLKHFERVEQAEAAIERVHAVLLYAEQVAATSGPGPASAVQAVAERLAAAIAGPRPHADAPAVGGAQQQTEARP